MKSTTLLCIALPVFIIGTALSLVVYARDVNTNMYIGPQPPQHEKAHFIQAYLNVPIFKHDSSPHQSARTSQEGANITRAHVENTALALPKETKLEPAAIFLFGAGVAGLASFTRRRFKI